MARLIGVAVILAAFAMTQSTLMAAPYMGATKASSNSNLMDRLIDILSAVWGGGSSNNGHSAVWGGGSSNNGHSAVWGGGSSNTGH